MVTFKFNATIGSVNIKKEEAKTIINAYSFFIDEESKSLIKDCYPVLTKINEFYYSPFEYSEKDEVLYYPTGLLPPLLKFFNQYHDIQFERTYSKVQLKEEHQLQELLRPEQVKYVKKALEKKRGYLQAFTSFGKSYCISEILNHFKKDTIRLVMVPTIDLLIQFQKDLSTYLNIDKSEIGIIGNNNFNIKPITICIPNTIYSKLKTNSKKVLDYLEKVEVLIIDELHKHCNPTGASVINNCINAEYKLATSATPNVKLPFFNECVYGPKLIKFEQQEGIQKNYIENPKILFIKAPTCFCSPKVLTRLQGQYSHKLYNIAYTNLIVRNKYRNSLIIRLAKKLIYLEEGPILILFKRKEHAEILLELLSECNFEIRIIHGDIKVSDRNKIIKELEHNDCDICLASEKIFSDGISINALAAAINVAAGNNQNQIIQQLGRLIRNRNKNLRPYFIDFEDEGYFSKQSSNRKKICKENYDYVITTSEEEIHEHF